MFRLGRSCLFWQAFLLLDQSFDYGKAEIAKFHGLLVIRAHRLSKAHVLVALGDPRPCLITLVFLHVLLL